MTQSNVLTISQGLRRVKKLKGLLAEAQTRATQGSSWTEGKDPSFAFEAINDAVETANHRTAIEL